MKEKLSLIACVAVIAIVAYAAWLLADVDKASVARLNQTLKTVSDTIGTPPPASTEPDQTKTVLYSGIAILFVATVYTLVKK